MEIQENKVGVVAFGVKTGIITFDDKIVDVVKNSFKDNPDMLRDGDIICITEAVVAITQHNYIHLDDITREVRQKLGMKEDSTLGLVYPILSRNRFSMILKAISKTVPKGKIIIQLLFPADEQGNPIIDREYLKKINKHFEDKITVEDIGNNIFYHPETGVDYISFYREIIEKEGAKAEIYLANSTKYITEEKPDGIIVCNVHHRNDTLRAIRKRNYKNVISLQDIYSDSKRQVYSEWGLLGSNILDPVKETLKLAPRNADIICKDVQDMVKKEFNKDVEVIVYGDGAYKDPESGIYELADPVSVFGVTENIKNKNRVGVKTKYLMQKLYSQGKSKEEILEIIKEEKQRILKQKKKDDFASEGTTPRKIENLVSSLADLVSGSADANTPIVVVRGFLE